MDQRRYYGLRAPRSIGHSTFMVPQLENYTLFASPYVDLNKKLSKLFKGFKQDATAQSETDTTAESNVKQKGSKRRDEKKSEEVAETSTDETNGVDSTFGIVLNVATVKPEDLEITFGKGNEIEVRVNQKDAKLSRMDITFSRNCSYKYQLPDDVDKKSLVALRTSDDYLIILPEGVLRQDLLKKAIKTLAESSDNAVVTPEETEIVDIEGKKSKSKRSDSKDTSARKGSDSKDTSARKGSDSKDTSARKGSDSKESGSKGSKSEEVGASSESEPVLNENSLTPVQVSRLLRPGMDIFILRKYMVDFESYVSTVRKFIENASFITQNSKTPELALKNWPTVEKDKNLEMPNKKPENKLAKEESTESGIYTLTPDASDKSEEVTPDASDKSEEVTPDASDKSEEATPDISDESSRSSTVKSEE